MHATMVGRPILHPVHAILLAFPVALFPSAFIADIAYLNTAEIQWSNFAAWAITGAMLFGAAVFIWEIVSLFWGRARHARKPALVLSALLAVMLVAGLINALQHSRDAWSSVGATGLILSLLCTLLALAAGWIAYSGPREIVQ
ncbi:DUF2231 domain-containing protein [Iodidimonas sp. SYSU 1G8]|uniref:DUF2231 domain-containing protein n=1 Tax=Iodidimonas sp. SYSU 1G8 TaxID=3133967 RepID=UPI0031FE649C